MVIQYIKTHLNVIFVNPHMGCIGVKELKEKFA